MVATPYQKKVTTAPTPWSVDLRGATVGRWTVVALEPERSAGHVRWTCRCACGFEAAVRATNLKRGISRGCYRCRLPDAVAKRWGKASK
jgi:hypothetical protein